MDTAEFKKGITIERVCKGVVKCKIDMKFFLLFFFQFLKEKIQLCHIIKQKSMNTNVTL